jgi:hypothetical protein
MAVNKDFVVKNSLRVGGQLTVGTKTVETPLDSATANSLIDSAFGNVVGGSGITYTHATKTFELTDTTVTPGSYGDSSTIPALTVNSHGQITAISGKSVNIPAGYDNTNFDSDFATKTTSNLAEGSNLYYTTSRFDTAFSGKSTSDLSEGTNLYYTDARVGSYLSSNGYDTATNIVASIVDTAPTTLDTLNELAAALGDDPNFATTVSAQIGALPDSSQVSLIISADVDKTFVDALNINADTLDAQQGTYYLNYNNFTNTPNVLDSADVRNIFSASGDLSYNSGTGVFSVTVPAGYATSDFNTDFATKSTTDLSEGTNLYYTTARANSAIDARVTQSFVNALNVDADTLDGLNSTQFLRSDADDQTTNILAIGSASGAISGEKLRVTDSGTFIASFQRTDGTPHLLFKGTGGTSGHTGRFYMDNGAFQLSQGDATGSQSGNIWLHGTSAGNIGIGTTSPQAKLQIAGSSIISNNTTIDPDANDQCVIAGTIQDTGWGALGIGGRNGTGGSWGLAHNGSALYLGMGDTVSANTMTTVLRFDASGTSRTIVPHGSVVPSADNTYNLGSTSSGWANIYTGDLHLSNEKHEIGNSVDGTKGNWTIQEGETDLYIINNKSGKKYKFSLEEIQ